ncbi:hypothetical protein [Clostridium tagluense]|uniref:hypothetical protein n=1 Tax=Clostridium tagluense TaxID=360422 RepID=UPI001CF1FB46|nr:hypothetical protein [Clostridium tagluense]MCB2300415.1 hypothetical protein [Clostridium tagluense]
MNEIEVLKLYKKDLEKIIAREEIKIQKEIVKQDLKLKAIFEEYPTEDDVMSSYGYGCITAHKKDQLLKLFRTKDSINNGESVDGEYLDLLKRDLSSIKFEIEYPDETPLPNIQHDPRIEELEKENKKLKTELKNKAEKYNERGAGRKSKFTEQEVTMIKMYRIQKKTIKELAEMYNCSVGLIHKLINE